MKLSGLILGGAILLSPIQLFAADLVPGTVAIYSNGQVKKLSSANDEWTLWESARKRLYKESTLPYLPTLEYRRFPSEAGGYEQQVIPENLEKLIPFGAAETIAFTVRRVKSDGESSSRQWRCQYEGKGEERVMEQNQRVLRYSCKRVNPFSRSPLKETREITFAPDLGVVVQETVLRPGRQDKTSRLEYLLPPNEASYARIAELVKDLRD